MSVLFLATATATGAAAAALGYPLLKRRQQASSASSLLGLMPKTFNATHQYADARSKALLACDLKSATVFISTGDKQEEPTLVPVQQLENVALVEDGKSRVNEVRLDIALADERRSLFQIHFLNGSASRTSEQYLQARQLADLWAVRLKPDNQDVASLRAAMAADPVAACSEEPMPRSKIAAIGGLAAVSALSLTMATLSQPTDTQQLAAATPQQPTQPVAVAAKAEPVEEVSIAATLEPLYPRIDDISERSLMQASRVNTDMVLKALDEIDAISVEIENAEVIVVDPAERSELAEIKAYLVSTQQDVLPRYRRLFSSALENDPDMPISAIAGGYASRELTLAHETLSEHSTRRSLQSSLETNLYRLRFARVEFRTMTDGSAIESQELNSDNDAILGAAMPPPPATSQGDVQLSEEES